jgi:hypothetical protein
MENQNQQLTENAFADSGSFEMAQRMAMALSKSELIPKAYQGNIPSTMIALELSKRTGVSPIMVMQNLHVIQGKPSWSSSFIIAVINSYKKFSMPLNFELKGEGDKRSCIAFTTGTDGQRYESPEVNIKMAIDEGWMSKAGSKWKTMPDLMLRYRSAAFFGRLYCPELLMGMQSDDEIVDVVKPQPIDKEHERIVLMIQDAKTINQLDKLGEQVDMTPEQIDLFNQKREEVSNVRK